jgi:AraC-like DNA-binding protein
MRYVEIPPEAPLTRFIECLWTLESARKPEPAEAQKILPDGCVELILNFGAPFREHRHDGTAEVQPAYFLFGQMTRPIIISPTGPVQLLGIRFHPGGSFPFFEFPADSVTNRLVELSAFGETLARNLVARCSEARSMPERTAAARALLREQLNRSVRDSRLVSLAAEIVRLGGRVSVDRLANAAGVSRRQLERRFLQEVGIGPKLLCRILRFQQVFRAMEENGDRWAATAITCGYFDQSHLIRDFQDFAGEAPSVLYSNSGLLTELFTRKHRASHFSNTQE